MPKMKVLFCGAHPDDAEIYSFGTLLAYVHDGAQVVIALATAGEGGLTVRSKHQPLAITRMAEAEAAAAMLPARLVQLGLPDGGLSSHRAELLASLQTLVQQTGPDVILTHSANDYHPDHRMLSTALAFVAADRMPVFYIDNMKGRNFSPSHYVDISKLHSKKMLALRQHQSQKPRRYVLAATALAEARGYEATGQEGAMMEGLRFDPNPAFKNAAQLLPKGTIAAPKVVFQRLSPIEAT